MNKKIVQRLLSFSFIFTVALFGAAAVEAQSKKVRRQAEDLAKEAKKAFGKNNFSQAVEKFGASIALVPRNPEAHFWKGYAHYRLKENDKALAEFDVATQQGYAPLEVFKLRWALNFEKKNYDAALGDLQQALKLDPKDKSLYRGLGDVYLEKQMYTDALEAYKKASADPATEADFHYNVARVYSNLGDFKAQTESAVQALAKGTRFAAEANYLLADGYHKQKMYPEAIDAFKKAVAANPKNLTIYRTMADIYRMQNRFNDAIDISRKALEQTPTDGVLFTDLSWYYSLADRHDEAIQAAQAGIRLLPNQYMAYTNLCRAYNDTDKPQLAVAACNSALRLNPNDGETYFYLGRAYNLLNKPDEATKNYKRAVVGLVEYTKNNLDYAEGFYLLGNAYFADNQWDKAIEAYKKCLALSPRFVKARYNMGIILVLQKNRTAAMEQYTSLLAIDQNLAGKLKAEIDKPQ